MKANEILEAVAATITQRGEQNGYDKKEERSAAEVARLFNTKTGYTLSEADAWQFMICLKEVRLIRQLQNNGDILDTLTDLVAYNTLMAECLAGKK